MNVDLREVFDTADCPIFGIDAQGLVIEWNLKTARITGYSREEVLQQPFVTTLLAPENWKLAQHALDVTSQGVESHSSNILFMNKDQDVIPVQVNFSKGKNSNGEAFGGECYFPFSLVIPSVCPLISPSHLSFSRWSWKQWRRCIRSHRPFRRNDRS